MPATKKLYKKSKRLWARWPLISATLSLIALAYLAVALPQGLLIIPGLLLVALSCWFFFASPGVCMARTRQDLRCRRNSKGIVGGCHLVQHKSQTIWQRLKPVSDLPNPETMDFIKSADAVIGSVTSLVVGLAAIVTFFTG